jgi:hypothetical protein
MRVAPLTQKERRQIRREPPPLVVDQAVQRGTKEREAKLISRKNDESYVLNLTPDLAAIDWHLRAAYAGREFLFSKTGNLPRYIDSHVRPGQPSGHERHVGQVQARLGHISDPTRRADEKSFESSGGQRFRYRPTSGHGTRFPRTCAVLTHRCSRTDALGPGSAP